MSAPESRPSLETLLAHSSWVRSLAHSLVADPTSAEDVAQQAWASALERPPAHDGNLKSWWASVVRSAAGRMWRDQERRKERGVEGAVAEASVAEEPDVEELAIRLETFRMLAAAVSQLPDPYGAAIYLRYFEDLSVAEVGRRQGVPEATAQSRIRRGLEQLRGALKHQLGGDWQARCQVFALPMVTAATVAKAGTGAGLMATLIKSPAAIVVSLVAMVSLIWWWQEGESKPPVEQTQAAAVAPLQEDEPVAADVAPAGNEETLERQELPQEGSRHAGFLPSAAEGLEVTVEDSTGKVVPFAEVLAIDFGGQIMTEDRLYQGYAIGLNRFLSMFGDRYRADASGKVRVGAPNGNLWLIGSTEQTIGIQRNPDLSTLAKEGGAVRLVLDRVQTIPVKVVNQNGLPVASATVSLAGDDGGFGDGMLDAITNEDGLAWLKVMPDLVRDRKQPVAARVLLNILGSKPIFVEVDLWDIPTEPLSLEMPPTGQVEVFVRDASGALANGHYLAALGGLLPETTDGIERRIQDFSLAFPVVDGRAFFPYVALGRELRGMAMETYRMESLQKDFVGPVVAGELITVEITPVAQFSVVRGRILNAEGAVAKNLQMGLEVKAASRNGMSIELHDIRTDLDGYFRLPLDRLAPEGTTRSLTVLMRSTKRKPSRHATLELPQQLELGETQLGDFVLEETPILVEGIVRDEKGQPVMGAKVMVRSARLPEDDFRSQRVEKQTSSISLAGATEDGWLEREDLRITTKQNGRFSIRSVPQPRPYEVIVKHWDYHETTQAFAPGEQGVEVFLQPKLRMKGRVLLDPSIPTEGISASLERPHPNLPGETFGYGVFLTPEGRFDFRGLEPDTYHLILRSQFLKEELYAHPGIYLDFSTEPHQIPDIDLRGQLHAITAKVVNSQGKVIPNVELFGPEVTYSIGYSQVQYPLVSRQPSFDFEVSAEGYRSVAVQGATSSQKLILEKGIPVRIAIANWEILHPDWDLSIQLVEVDPRERHDDHRAASLDFDEHGVARARFAWPGRFRLAVQVYHARNNDSVHRWVECEGEEDTRIFEVQDSTELQEIFIMLDEVLIAATIDHAKSMER